MASSPITSCEIDGKTVADFIFGSLPVHHQLLEFAQTHVHRVSDAIQPSHPLSPSPPLSSLMGRLKYYNLAPYLAK